MWLNSQIGITIFKLKLHSHNMIKVAVLVKG